MFRTGTGRYRCSRRLGYGRGDVPSTQIPKEGSFVVGLRARGCSRSGCPAAAVRGGWATGAGMFLRQGGRGIPVGRLGYGRGDVPSRHSRPSNSAPLGYGRGDVPSVIEGWGAATEVGLRARGCSPASTHGYRGDGGWATGAGMFPMTKKAKIATQRLGYGRGDVPSALIGAPGCNPVGLRARGCSLPRVR